MLRAGREGGRRGVEVGSELVVCVRWGGRVTVFGTVLGQGGGVAVAEDGTREDGFFESVGHDSREGEGG